MTNCRTTNYGGSRFLKTKNMNKFIIIDKKEIFFKNILIESDRIMASDENYGSESAFREKMASGKVGKLDTVINVRYAENRQSNSF